MEMSTLLVSAPSGMATEVPSPRETIPPEGPIDEEPPDFLHPIERSKTNQTAAVRAISFPLVEFYHVTRPHRGTRCEAAPGDRQAAHVRHHLAPRRGKD